MWPPASRGQSTQTRRTPRYQTDLTDTDWRLIEPQLPPAKTTGRPRAWPMREIVNAIFYVMRGGIAWRVLASDVPPGAQSIAGSPLGVTAACSSGSTMRW